MGLFACKREEPQTTAAPAPDAASQGVVDSIFTVEEDIQRFKAARGNPSATRMNNASPSRDALVERFIKAIEVRDTAEMRAMVINDAEFIDLYYPTSMYVKAPYKQSPDLVWFLMQESGAKGSGRMLDRFGGRPANYEGYICSPEPIVRGANRFWGECAVRWTPAPGAASSLRLFGPIMERDGQFKFVSYANDL